MAKQESTTKNTAIAKLNHLRISPRKVRLVADIIRGLLVEEAEAQLMLTPKRAGIHLLKLLRSAISNAKSAKKMDTHKLYIKELRVDEGPTLKRWRPRAMGTVGTINKRTSHVSLVLEERKEAPASRFVIPKPEHKKKEKEKEKEERESKKEKKPEARPEVKPEIKAEKPKERKNPFRKIFRRKSV